MHMANNTNPVVRRCCYSWSDLPHEVLELIMSHVTTTFGLLRCRGVCRSWRCAALRVLSSSCDDININNGGVPKSSITPLLLLYGNKDLYSDDRKLLCVGKNTTTEYRYRAPNMRRLSYKDAVMGNMVVCGRKSMERFWMADDEGIEEEVADSGGAVPKRTRCIAPYRGWLLLYPLYESALYLFNPLTRMVVQLPPPPKPEMIFDPKQLRFITSSSNILTCMLYLYTTPPLSPLSREVLSPREVAVYRFSDREWTPVFTRNYNWLCVIFYKDYLYSVDEFGVLRRSLFDQSYSNYQEEEVSKVSNSTVINPDPFTYSYRYLVESWSGELLMVVRKREIYVDFNGKLRTRTNLFEIFKFNWSNGEWEEDVTNFSDQALFLAHNDSKFYSVRHNPEYKPNSIYFIEDTDSWWNEDFGVYDLANRKVEPLNLSHQHMQYPYYRWFQPVL